MDVLRFDRADSPLGPPRRLKDGRVVYDGVIAAPGIHVYVEGGVEIRELVPASVLADLDWLSELPGATLVVEHPEDVVGQSIAVDGDNFRKLAVGVNLSYRHGPGGEVIGELSINATEGHEAIRSGKQGLSPRYYASVDPTPGIDPVFGQYDRKQIKRSRTDQIAICDMPRGGPKTYIRRDAIPAPGVSMDPVEALSAVLTNMGITPEQMPDILTAIEAAKTGTPAAEAPAAETPAAAPAAAEAPAAAPAAPAAELTAAMERIAALEAELAAAAPAAPAAAAVPAAPAAVPPAVVPVTDSRVDGLLARINALEAKSVPSVKADALAENVTKIGTRADALAARLDSAIVDFEQKIRAAAAQVTQVAGRIAPLETARADSARNVNAAKAELIALTSKVKVLEEGHEAKVRADAIAQKQADAIALKDYAQKLGLTCTDTDTFQTLAVQVGSRADGLSDKEARGALDVAVKTRADGRWTMGKDPADTVTADSYSPAL